MRSRVFAAKLSVVFCFLFCFFMLTGCERRHVPVQYFAAIDASASNSGQLGSAVYLTYRLAGMMSGQDHLTVYRVDDAAKAVFDDAPPADTDLFQAKLVDDTKALSTEQGTHSLRFWEAAAKRMSADKPLVLLYITDGFEENMTAPEEASLRETVALLAAGNTRAVYVLGVDRSRQAFWRSIFQGLGSRFHLDGDVSRNSISHIEAAVDAPCR